MSVDALLLKCSRGTNPKGGTACARAPRRQVAEAGGEHGGDTLKRAQLRGRSTRGPSPDGTTRGRYEDEYLEVLEEKADGPEPMLPNGNIGLERTRRERGTHDALVLEPERRRGRA